MKWIFPILLLACAALIAVAVSIVWTADSQSLLIMDVTHGTYVEPIDSVVRPLAALRVRLLHQCPWQGGVPQTPIGFVAATEDPALADRETVEEVLRVLLSDGCDINAYNAWGETPLHDAILFNDARMVAFLLDHGADPSKRRAPYPNMTSKRAQLVGLDALAWARYLAGHGAVKMDRSAIISLLERSSGGA
jgi:hypothetical protein